MGDVERVYRTLDMGWMVSIDVPSLLLLIYVDAYGGWIAFRISAMHSSSI